MGVLTATPVERKKYSSQEERYSFISSGILRSRPTESRKPWRLSRVTLVSECRLERIPESNIQRFPFVFM